MRPLFHYCSHYFSFSLFNPISFMQTLCPDIVIFHQLNLNHLYKHKTFIRNRLQFLMSLLFSLSLDLYIEACQVFLNKNLKHILIYLILLSHQCTQTIYDIHPQVYSHQIVIYSHYVRHDLYKIQFDVDYKCCSIICSKYKIHTLLVQSQTTLTLLFQSH